MIIVSRFYLNCLIILSRKLGSALNLLVSVLSDTVLTKDHNLAASEKFSIILSQSRAMSCLARAVHYQRVTHAVIISVSKHPV